MKFSTALRTARAQAIVDAAGVNPKIKFYTGVESLTPAGNLLATLDVVGALGSVANGVLDYNEVFTQTNTSHVAGMPTFALITTDADVGVNTLAIPGELSMSSPVVNGVNMIWNPSTSTESNQ